MIVIETNVLNIYDGDDPDLPLWMSFTGSATNIFIIGGGATGRVVSAKNGKVVFGMSYDLHSIDFITDSKQIINAVGYADYRGNIAQRNDSAGNTYYTDSSRAILNRTVNDVSMTVLPDAPIDPATGLPVPTIAVATNGGVSVIKDDGTVVDITTATNIEAVVVGFKNNGVWMVAEYSPTGNSQVHMFYDLPMADTTYVSADKNYAFNAIPNIAATTSVNDASITAATHLSGDNMAFGCDEPANYGLTFLNENPAAPANGMVAYTTSTYNTGWMNGDIKGAFLSDTDDTDLVGTELVATAAGINTNTASYAFVNEVMTAVAGKTYNYSYDVRFTGDPSQYEAHGFGDVLTVSSASTWDIVYNSSHTENFVTFSGSFISTANTLEFGARSYPVGGVGTVTVEYQNLTVTLADEDRSVNANGLTVNGTVTRSPVATGADLVAYSGWSYEGNYLQQPYTGDLDFGTGDLSIMGWYKASGGGYHPIAVYNINDTANSGWGFRYSYSASRWEFKIGASYASYTDTRPQSQTWGLFALVRRSGVVSIYWNAELIGSLSQANDGSLSGAELHIGEGSNYPSFIGAGNFVNGSLALLRISATAPTAEQISRIYNDEKALFQENAQATLYGTSDAVTALAHDDVTNLLHVGTSAGRSVFQGLRRVENTTAAVGTAISASNGMVVEE